MKKSQGWLGFMATKAGRPIRAAVRPHDVRRKDPETSHQAAAGVRRKVNQLHERVIAAYRQHGELSARQVEQLPEFTDLGFSTTRKRVSELASESMGFLLDTGRKETKSGRTGATVYRLRREFR